MSYTREQLKSAPERRTVRGLKGLLTNPARVVAAGVIETDGSVLIKARTLHDEPFGIRLSHEATVAMVTLLLASKIVSVEECSAALRGSKRSRNGHVLFAREQTEGEKR